MKIAIDARIIYTSTGRYVERLLEHLQQIDKKNEYFVLLMKEDYDRWVPQAKNFKKVVADYPPYTFAEQLGFAALLYRLDVDLVHFTMPQHPLTYVKAFVITIHDLTLIEFVNKRSQGRIADIYKNTVKPAAFKQVMKRAVYGAKHIITPTEYVKEQIISLLGCKREKISHTYEAAELLAAKPKAYEPMKDRKFILYVGNAYPYKNLERLVDAFAKQKDKDLNLVLAGKPDYFYNQLEKYVKQRKYKRIHFAGFVPDAELAWLYKNASLYVFPSLSEGFGLPGVEAMVYGLPVASSTATCLPEVYGDAAVYFDPEDTADMADVIGMTLNSQIHLRELKKRGLAKAGEYSWRRMAEQTLEIYKNSA